MRLFPQGLEKLRRTAFLLFTLLLFAPSFAWAHLAPRQNGASKGVSSSCGVIAQGQLTHDDGAQPCLDYDLASPPVTTHVQPDLKDQGHVNTAYDAHWSSVIPAITAARGPPDNNFSLIAAKTPLKYHYTTAEELSFKGGLWRDTSVTDKLYTDPFKASQELGIPVPNKVIPIKDAGQFVPNKPPIVQPSYRYQGGGADFINPEPVPPEYLLPARPLGGG